jgi:translocation and assembly module TamB
MKSIWIKIGTITILFLALCFGAYWLAFTNNGLNWAFNTANKLIPGKLIVNDLNGSLLKTITAKQITYNYQGFSLEANDVQLSLDNLFIILQKKIVINQLVASSVNITLPPQKSAKIKTQKQKLKSRLPVLFSPKNESILDGYDNKLIKFLPSWDIALKNGQLQNITVISPNFKRPAKIDNLDLAFTLANHRLDFINLKLLAPNASIIIYGKIAKKYDFNWQIDAPKLQNIWPTIAGSLNSKGTITGEKNSLKINTFLYLNNFSANRFNIGNLTAKIITSTIQYNLIQIDLAASNLKFDQYHIPKINLTIKTIINSLSKKAPDIGAELNIAPFSIYDDKYSQKEPLTLQETNIKAHFNTAGLNTSFSITIKNQPPLKGEILLDRKKNITGALSWQTHDLTSINKLIPQIRNLTGNLTTSIKLTGPINEPKWQGTVAIDRLSFNVPFLNVAIHNSFFNADITPDKIAYKSSLINSQNNALQIYGNTNLTSNNRFDTELSLNGKNFLVANTKIAQIYISPNLKFTSYKEHLNLTGDISIPKASLKIAKFQGVDTLPNDIVFTDEKKQNIPALPNVSSKITVTLGDNIWFDIMDLKGKPTGSLIIENEPQKPTIANGKIVIHDGTYNIYNQELTINNSSLNFINSPIDNPNLDISATRTIKAVGTSSVSGIPNGDILVGLRMRGPADNPQNTLFSEPANLSQEDIFSYLMLGQSSSQLGKNQAGLLVSAAQAINLGGLNKLTSITDSLKKKLGFTELDVEDVDIGQKSNSSKTGSGTNSTTSETSIVLGRYITPSLYISYSMSLIYQISIFRVRYNLWKHFSVQTEASQLGTGIDFLYSIMRQ